MKIGIIGSKKQMTDVQCDRVIEYLATLPVLTEIHHGDSVGVDDDIIVSANEMNHTNDCPFKIVCHPPDTDKCRAYNKCHHEIFEKKSCTERNKDIVDSTDLVIIIPAEDHYGSTGRTWFSYNYAMERNKFIAIFWPDGTIN